MFDSIKDRIRRFWQGRILQSSKLSDKQKKEVNDAIDFVLVGPGRDELEVLPNVKLRALGNAKVQLRLEGKLWPPTVGIILEFKGDAASIMDIEGV